VKCTINEAPHYAVFFSLLLLPLRSIAYSHWQYKRNMFGRDATGLQFFGELHKLQVLNKCAINTQLSHQPRKALLVICVCLVFLR